MFSVVNVHIVDKIDNVDNDKNVDNDDNVDSDKNVDNVDNVDSDKNVDNVDTPNCSVFHNPAHYRPLRTLLFVFKLLMFSLAP